MQHIKQQKINIHTNKALTSVHREKLQQSSMVNLRNCVTLITS